MGQFSPDIIKLQILYLQSFTNWVGTMDTGNCTGLTSNTADVNPATVTSQITTTSTQSSSSKLEKMRMSPVDDSAVEEGIEEKVKGGGEKGDTGNNSVSLPSKTSPPPGSNEKDSSVLSPNEISMTLNPSPNNNKKSVTEAKESPNCGESQAEKPKKDNNEKEKETIQVESKTSNTVPDKTTEDNSKQSELSRIKQTDKSLDNSQNKGPSKSKDIPKAAAQSSSSVTNNNKSPSKTKETPSPLIAGSSSKNSQGRRYSSATGSPERPPLSGFRKLSIQPRTTQYEPNPLLQGHNEQGRTLLEEMFAERLLHTQDSLNKLQPRGASCERGGLLQRNASGLTELEVYLQEREREITRNPMTKASSVDSTSSMASARRAMLLRQQSMPETRPRLEPRVSQFEQHALLAEKDNSGMSILDAFLQEKEHDIEQGSDNGSITSKGKCSEKCTCKNANCTVCKGPGSKSAYSTPSSSGSHPPLMKKESSRETVIEPKANNKRVHFSESGEEEENGQQQVDSDSNKPPSTNQKTQNSDNIVMDKCRTTESKCKAKAKRKCVVS